MRHAHPRRAALVKARGLVGLIAPIRSDVAISPGGIRRILLRKSLHSAGLA